MKTPQEAREEFEKLYPYSKVKVDFAEGIEAIGYLNALENIYPELKQFCKMTRGFILLSLARFM